MSYKADFSRFAGLSTLPGLPSREEGVKDEAYREGLAAGDAVVKALRLGWAKAPKDNTKKAWAPVVAKYAGDQEFMNDSQWTKGFGSALTGHFGKDMKLEWVEPASEDDDLEERSFHHGTIRQWQNGRHLKNGASWERIKTGRPQRHASKMPNVLDIVQGSAPPESLGPPIASPPPIGVVGAGAEMSVAEAVAILSAQVDGEEAFDENVMKMVFGVLRKVTGRKEPMVNKPITPSKATPVNMYQQIRQKRVRTAER